MLEDEIAAFPYSIRNFQPGDTAELAGIYRGAGGVISPQQLAEHLARPSYCPERDLFLAVKGAHTVGYMDLTAEPVIGRAVLDCWVHLSHRGRGLAARLLEPAMRRAAEMGLTVAHANIMEDNTTGQEILSRLGFAVVRRFLEYELDMAALDREAAAEALRCCRYLEPGEEAELTRIQNVSFNGSWGYNPNTLETIIYRTHLAHFSARDVLFTEVGGQVAGYCWTEVRPAWMEMEEGRICMLGIDPEYRSRGLGRRLLLAGLEHLAEIGVKKAVLTVDSENQPACALYWSVGFTLRIGSLWYEKAVAADTIA